MMRSWANLNRSPKKTDPSPEDADRGGELKSELKTLQTSIEKLTGFGSIKSDVAAFDAWNNEPVNGLAQPNGNGDGFKSNGTEKKSVGKTEINLLTGEAIHEGAGILTGPQIKAMTDPEYLRSYNSFLRNRGVDNIKSADERKSLSAGIDVDGGYIVPPEMLSGIIKREPTPTRIVDMVRTESVSSDRAMMLKSNYEVDDLYSSAVRVYPTAEGGKISVTDQPAFGMFNVDIHQYTAELSVSRQLLEDTAFDLVGFMTGEFRTAYRNFLAVKVLLGSGVGEHFGILTRAASNVNNPGIVKSGDAAKLTWTGLRKIKNAVPEQYDDNCRYVFNKKSTQDAIEELVDNNGRQLWPEAQRAGLVNGVPGSLQGYGYVREAFMPDIAANAFPYIFGDLRGYFRAMRLGMTIEPYREIEARRGQVVFLARFRDGGDVAEPWRIKVGKIAA